MSAIRTIRYDAELGLMPVATTVLWLGCIAIGVGGLVLHYHRPTPPAKLPAPVETRVVHVDLTPLSPAPQIGSAAPAVADAAPAEPQPPAPPAAAIAPSAPPLIAVATPSPAISFAVPVEGPTRIVDAKEAVPLPRNTTPATQQAPSQAVAPQRPAAPQRLTFGQGEGAQPPPEYPREAAFAHEQGTVLIRFTVDEDGRVLDAQVAKPCPYAMLNRAALRAVRDTWRFAPGSVRSYEVPIEFQLVRH
jgi:periplasmic protein TonB